MKICRYYRYRKINGFIFSLAFVHSIACAVDDADTQDSDEPMELEQIRISGTALNGSSTAGYRVDTVQLGPFGDARPQDTPFSINSVSSELIRNTQATTTTEALKYVPTVYNNTSASQITPYFTIRGFSASTWSYNMAVDGMRSFDVYQPMEDKERIEVINGATGFLYGITSPAGMINHALKRPTATPLHEFTVGIYDEQVYGHLDLGGPLSENLSYRINLVQADKGDTGGIANQTQKRHVFSGALDWRLGAQTLLRLDASRSRRNLEYAQALFMTTAAIGIPKAPDTSRNRGAPYTGATDATNRFGIGLDTRLNDIFSLRFKARYSKVEREYLLNRQVWQNKQLDYRWRVDSQQEFDTIVKQLNLFVDADFFTGPLKHKITLGVTRDAFDAANSGYRGTTYSTQYPGDLYEDPQYRPYSLPPKGTSTSQETHYTTVIMADQIDIGDYWSLMVGGTRARVDDHLKSRTAAGALSTTRYDQSEFSPAYSLSFKPFSWITAYGTYVEALQQGLVAGATTANAGEIFSPYVSKQKEFGIKSTLGAMELNLAWFHIENANQYVNPATNTATQDGKAIHKGWEFTFTGRATDNLTLVGGFTRLNARIDRAATNVGKTPQGVPEKMATLYAEYDLATVPGLTLNGGLSYTGKVPWDAANKLYVNPVTIYETGLRYRARIMDKTSTWRLNIANLTNKNYWTTRSGILYPGAPRTVSLSTTLAF
ncbi:TonB-dependent receptor [Azomonas macrocytogenes]|uniref:Iron complex outermembrane receptor protein n=1 Tax=Azomonas macrocytogenes TaxID=69962 RepID=A0A839TA88_AZOMA|nr:TonB-dependent siderophore receptor [Azomonas macrocytogenes]MBB3104543.1 iron complex outermembrane receptor protein [Azomonas macrocytogenes]